MVPYRVLILERAPNIRRALGQLLTDEGFEVATAYDTETAVSRARVLEPAVIVIELETEGDLAAVRELASVTRQIIVIAPYGRGPLAIEAMSAGASDYILKPISRAELLVVIQKAIEQFELARELTELRLELGRLPT